MGKGRFEYYQPNYKDIKDETGDCQIRALSKALNLSWTNTFDLIIPICRKHLISEIFSGCHPKTKAAMKELGFKYHGVYARHGVKRPTVDSFAGQHGKGAYILRTAGHAVAVKDGKYYDTWDCGRCEVYGYYEKIEG